MRSQSPSFGVFVFGCPPTGSCGPSAWIVSIPIVRGLRLRRGRLDDGGDRGANRLNPHRSGSSSSAEIKTVCAALLTNTSQSPSFGVFVFGLLTNSACGVRWPFVSIPIVRGLRLRPSVASAIAVVGGVVSIPIVRGLRLRPEAACRLLGLDYAVSIPIVRGLRLRHLALIGGASHEAFVSIPIVRGLRLRQECTSATSRGRRGGLNPHRSGSSSSATSEGSKRSGPATSVSIPIVRGLRLRQPGGGVPLGRDAARLNPHRSGSSSSARGGKGSSPRPASCLNPHRSGSSSSALRVVAWDAAGLAAVSIPIVRGLRLRPLGRRQGQRQPALRLNPHRSGSSSSAQAEERAMIGLQFVSIPIVRGLRLRRRRSHARHAALRKSQSPSFGVFVFGGQGGDRKLVRK